VVAKLDRLSRDVAFIATLMAKKVETEESPGTATPGSDTRREGLPPRRKSVAQDAFGKIQELSPKTEAQRVLKDRAIQVATDVAQTRLLARAVNLFRPLESCCRPV
jgi:hypothetical protein